MGENEKSNIDINKIINKTKKIKKGLNALSIKNEWEKGKLEKIISGTDFFVSLLRNLATKAEENSLDEEFFNLHHVIIYELFNLKENIRYNQKNFDTVTETTNSKNNILHNESFSSFFENKLVDEFSENLQFVISEVLSEFTDKYNHFEINDKLDNLEDELVKSQISDSSFLVNFLLSSKIEMIDRLFSKIFPPFMKNNEWLIEDKIDLIIRIVTHLEGSLKEDKQLVPFSTFSFFGKSITISKSTSDKYCIFLIKMYVQKLRGLGCEYTPNSFKKIFPKVQFKVDVIKLQQHLLKYVTFERGELETALNCKEVFNPIYFNHQQNSFVYFFHYKKSGLFVDGTKLTDVEDWIAFYFVGTNDNGKKIPLSKTMCHKILSNSKHTPKRNHTKIPMFNS